MNISVFKFIAPLFALVVCIGCAEGGKQKSYGMPGSAVKPISAESRIYFNGEFEKATETSQYIFYFDYGILGTLTDDARVSKYLLLNHLMPPNCKHGARIVRGGRGENGKAWLIFKCADFE